MTLKLGTTDATLRLGHAAYPTKAYLGDTLVAATVPGAPTITSATYSSFGAGNTAIIYTAPSDNGGSAITGYKFYFDGVLTEPTSITSSANFQSQDYTGAVAEVSAVNAVGEGAKSDPVTVT
ncbi:MAG: hypothetical protein O3A60_02750 [Planctomycetota bacterium]|nr:hypothetical protein [Planctomycetota bacterium]